MNNSDNWITDKFPMRDIIQIKFIEDIKLDNEEFYEVGIQQVSDDRVPLERFCVSKNDIVKLKDFCDKRNKEMIFNKENIGNYIDDDVLDMAENFLDIVEEDIMLDYRIVAVLHCNYSHNYSKIFDVYSDRRVNVKSEHQSARRYTRYLLFNQTKKKNEDLLKNSIKMLKIVDNFVEIIVEKRNVEIYIAKAIAWAAIQRKVIEYYSCRWIEEYDSKLSEHFSEFEEFLISKGREKRGMESSYANAIERAYIERVLLCEDIDIEHSKEILIYFLLSKYNMSELVLCDCFVEYYEIIQKIKQKIESSDIKQKLMTKQKRKTTKYTINDVDVMSGSEFEEFIGLLFKKMGYSTQVTKQSGDQGLDVIAIRRGTKIGIQAKCYSNTVGNSAIQEAVAGKSFYACDKVIVVTNNYFTSSAIELAQSNNVILWNRDMLKEKIKELM